MWPEARAPAPGSQLLMYVPQAPQPLQRLRIELLLGPQLQPPDIDQHLAAHRLREVLDGLAFRERPAHLVAQEGEQRGEVAFEQLAVVSSAAICGDAVGLCSVGMQ